MSRNLKSLPELAAGYIKKNSLISDRDHVLAAVSGGPDSVALLSILTNLRDTLGIERITVVHFDHRLRGDESDADREFVHAMARSAGLEFRCGTADVRALARSRKISVEMAARDSRHSFFMETAAALNARKIALGHTANDQAEEVILRIIRGTGPAGIQAMSPATAEGIIRPLLFATRDSILEYLLDRGIEFRNDSTNFEPFCQRNFLRLKIFPLLREAFHPQIAETIARCADLAREEESWWASEIRTRWGDICLESSEGRCALDLGRLKQLHPALVRRMLRFAIEMVRGNLAGVGLVHLESLIELVFSGKTGKSVLFPGGVEAVRHGGKLLVRLRECAASKHLPDDVLPIPGPGVYHFGEFDFQIGFRDDTKTCCQPGLTAECVHMDADKLKWPLELRFWKPGDRFRPLGMSGSKKLQDFFTDCMVPKDERQRVPLLCDSEKICLAVGMRMDDRVKVGPSTRAILVVRVRRLP